MDRERERLRRCRGLGRAPGAAGGPGGEGEGDQEGTVAGGFGHGDFVGAKVGGEPDGVGIAEAAESNLAVLPPRISIVAPGKFWVVHTSFQLFHPSITKLEPVVKVRLPRLSVLDSAEVKSMTESPSILRVPMFTVLPPLITKRVES